MWVVRQINKHEVDMADCYSEWLWYVDYELDGDEEWQEIDDDMVIRTGDAIMAMKEADAKHLAKTLNNYDKELRNIRQGEWN